MPPKNKRGNKFKEHLSKSVAPKSTAPKSISVPYDYTALLSEFLSQPNAPLDYVPSLRIDPFTTSTTTDTTSTSSLRTLTVDSTDVEGGGVLSPLLAVMADLSTCPPTTTFIKDTLTAYPGSLYLLHSAALLLPPPTPETTPETTALLEWYLDLAPDSPAPNPPPAFHSPADYIQGYLRAITCAIHTMPLPPTTHTHTSSQTGPSLPLPPLYHAYTDTPSPGTTSSPYTTFAAVTALLHSFRAALLTALQLPTVDDTLPGLLFAAYTHTVMTMMGDMGEEVRRLQAERLRAS